MLRPLRRCRSLTPTQRQKLERAKMQSARDVLVLSELELVHRLHLSAARVAELVAVVSADLAPRPRTALELWTRRRGADGASSALSNWLPTGLADLDAAMGGGIPAGSLTELVGDSGVGKTQLCLTLTALVAASDASAGVIYIDTEGKFSAARLAEIVRGRQPPSSDAASTPLDERDDDDDALLGAAAAGPSAALAAIVERVTVLKASSVAELAAHVGDLERLALETNARLIVIDSIAALARREYGGSVPARQMMLSLQATKLKSIAEGLALPVVVTNQLNAKRRTASSGGGRGDGRVGAAAANGVKLGLDAGVDAMCDASLVPALGNTWSHCVNSRLFLRRVDGGDGGDGVSNAWNGGGYRSEVQRSIAIVKSPIAGVFHTRFLLDHAGVRAEVEVK